jgi:hypothetical protein
MPASLAQFIDRHGITADVAPAASNPNASSFGPDAVHFTVTLRRSSDTTRSMVVPFSGGSPKAFAHTGGEPALADVLECLLLDATSLDDRSFEEWAEDMGADPDSRKAYALWETVQAQSADLAGFLGSDLFAEFLTVEAE